MAMTTEPNYVHKLREYFSVTPDNKCMIGHRSYIDCGETITRLIKDKRIEEFTFVCMYLSFIEKASLGLGFSIKRIAPFDSSTLDT